MTQRGGGAPSFSSISQLTRGTGFSAAAVRADEVRDPWFPVGVKLQRRREAQPAVMKRRDRLVSAMALALQARAADRAARGDAKNATGPVCAAPAAGRFDRRSHGV